MKPRWECFISFKVVERRVHGGFQDSKYKPLLVSNRDSSMRTKNIWSQNENWFIKLMQRV